MDIELITKGVGLASGLVEVATKAEQKKQAVELLGVILALQEKQQALVDEIAALKSQIAALLEEKRKTHDWKRTQRRYALTEAAPGVFVYAQKPDGKSNEPAHWLCPHCYQQSVKSHLQFERREYRNLYCCPACHTELILPDAHCPHKSSSDTGPRIVAFKRRERALDG
jgi:hypothetical protein